MSRRRASGASDASDEPEEQSLEKHRELYNYSTDILLRELERFNKADEKASKYLTTFVFLLGIVAYFDKWIFSTMQWPGFPVELPPDKPLFMAGLVGVLALLLSVAGVFLTNHAMKLHPIESRPLNQDMLEFFEKETMRNIYYGLARENSNAYNKNRAATDKKYTMLKRSFFLMILIFALVLELLLMYCLHFWT
jgi:hypothetical protein